MTTRPLLLFLCLLFALPAMCGGLDGIAYKVADGDTLRLDLYMPTRAVYVRAPVVVFIHGGSWQHGSRHEVRGGWQREFVGALQARGLAVASIDYRLVWDGRGDGPCAVCGDGDARYPAPLSDCKDAVRWVRRHAARYGLSDRLILTSGTSAGGHLALLTAYAPDSVAGAGCDSLAGVSSGVMACIDIYGPTQLSRQLYAGLPRAGVAVAGWVVGKALLDERARLLRAFTGQATGSRRARLAACRRYSPVSYASRAVPTLILHGDSDRMVRHSQSRKLLRRLGKAHVPAWLYTVRGRDHSFPGITPAEREALCRRVEEFLGQVGL